MWIIRPGSDEPGNGRSCLDFNLTGDSELHRADVYAGSVNNGLGTELLEPGSWSDPCGYSVLTLLAEAFSVSKSACVACVRSSLYLQYVFGRN